MSDENKPDGSYAKAVADQDRILKHTQETRYQPVTEEEFTQFLENYPEDLERDTSHISDPSVTSWNRKVPGMQWPETVVARRINHSEHGQPDTYEIKTYRFHIVKVNPQGMIFTCGDFWDVNQDGAMAQAVTEPSGYYQEKWTYGIGDPVKTPDQLARDAALKISTSWSVGTSSRFCDEVDWDAASVSEIAEVLLPFFEQLGE